MRILLVEDNEAMADAVRRGLIAEGFGVDVAHDGEEGLWRAHEFPYDALVLDVMLPGRNGYEICRTLRAEHVRTPILMLTAKSGDHDIAEGLDLGADDYLTKPFSFVVLVARLRAIVRRAEGSASSPVEIGPLSVDTLHRSCTYAGQRVDLTAREYALLESLARRPGVPMSRGELLDLVWGADYAGDSNVVDVYISYIRRKLSAAGPPTIIETIRGVGYRVVAP